MKFESFELTLLRTTGLTLCIEISMENLTPEVEDWVEKQVTLNLVSES